MRRLSNWGFVARRAAFFFCVRMVSVVCDAGVEYVFVYILDGVMGWVWCCLLLVMRIKSKMKGKERDFMLVPRAERGELFVLHMKGQV